MQSPLIVDRTELASHFEREALRLAHRVQVSPLFEIEALQRLARGLAARDLEMGPGGERAVEPTWGSRVVGADRVLRALERIDSCDSWIALKRVEQAPAYRELLERVAAEVTESVAPRCGRIHGVQGFLYVGSPHVIVPYHVDLEHGLLLQVSGTKTLRFVRRDNPDVQAVLDLDRRHSTGERMLALPEAVLGSAEAVRLGPGDAHHLPLHTPHCVHGGPAPTVALNLTFRSATLDRVHAVYRVNRQLRRLGLRPGPPGRRPSVDSVKRLGWDAWARAGALWSRRWDRIR